MLTKHIALHCVLIQGHEVIAIFFIVVLRIAFLSQSSFFCTFMAYIIDSFIHLLGLLISIAAKVLY